MLPTVPSPISKLNPDVLLHIFTLNIDPETYENITDLRHTSQVCASWRKLVLSSPGLWSNSLDFDAFSPYSQQEWKAEVMRRTGTSGLRIQAHKETLIDMGSWIHQVLDEHWARIRYLDLQFSRWCIPSEKWLSIFRRPAHRLESFQVRFHHSTSVSLSSVSSALFDNNAPRLRTFSVRYASLDLTKTSWASNLRCLQVTSSVPLFELIQAFFIIPFPFLESLELADSDGHAENPTSKPHSPHPISLPRLKQINIRPIAEIASSLCLLANMTPAPGCQLTFDASADLGEAFILDDLPRVVNQYLPDSPATTPRDPDHKPDPKSINYYAYFSLSKYSFNFYFRPHFTGPITFNCVLNCYAGLPGHAISAFATSMLAFPLRKIKKLSLYVSPGDTRSAPLVPHVDIDAAVEQFVRAAGGVEELHTTMQSLEWLEVFQKRTGEVVFPFVKKTRDSRNREVQIPRV